MEKNIILSLFDLTGNWSKPYKDNGYEVIQIDIQLGIDILEWNYKSIPKDKVYGILAAVPCTDYAVSGARWFKAKDEDGRTAKSQLLVDKTKEIIEYFEPIFWVVENPVSRIHKLNPWLREVKFQFHPYEFAGYGYEDERYTKRTCLWGKFNNPIKKPMEPEHTGDYGRIHYPRREDGTAVGWNTQECKNIRSATPLGFAEAFYLANNNR